MNRKMKATISALCGTLVAIALAAQSGGDTSRVQQLVQEMRKAQKVNDASWYREHLADGYIEGHSWGEWASKDEALKQMQNKAIQFTQGEISDIKVSTFGSDVAIAHYKFTYDATFNGTHRARTVICSDTWISRSGAWKLASDHCSHVEGT